ncbi:MAG TPA: hypothetical protein VGL97_05275 [Bryobacteraceae bacterium]|jgi:hypothetical protein
MQAAAQTWSSIGTVSEQRSARFMPSLTDLAFLLPAFLLFLKMSGTKRLFSDGDTGWHIRTGQWILEHHAVPTQDIFSFTKAHQPWFAWEWAWDVTFAGIHKFWGLVGVGFITVLLLSLSCALLYALVAKTSGNNLVGFAVTAFAFCGTTSHWLARPHLFSWVFFLLFLHLLRKAEGGRTKALYWLPGLTLIWTNTHGSFFVGIMLVLTTALGEAITAFWGKRESPAAVYVKCRPFLLCAAGCLAVTFVNPYTWHLHRHIFSYLMDGNLLDKIQEYQSTSFHHGQAFFFEGMLLVGLAASFRCLQRWQVTPALNILCWAHLALLSVRNIPLFLMVAAPAVACLLEEVIRHCKGSRVVGRFFASIGDICDEIRPFERIPRVHLTSALAILLLASLFAGGARGFEGEFNADLFPIQAISVIAASPARRIFTYDQWADYLLYRLYPAKQVFIDGRSDFYGDEIVMTSLHLINARYDCFKQLRRFAVDMVIVPPDAPLSTVLKGRAGWKLLFDDGKVLVFQAAQPGNVSAAGGKVERPTLAGA